MRKPLCRTVPRLEAMETRSLLSAVAPVLTMHTVRLVTAEVERTVMSLSRTHNMSLTSARLARFASQLPGGVQELAPVWQRHLAGYNPRVRGSARVLERQLLADLKQDVAHGVADGEFGLVGSGARAYLASAAPQASLDSVTIVNSTGFTIAVSAGLNGTNRTIPTRNIANGGSSLFDFNSSTNNFITIHVSRPGSNQPPPLTNILNRPIGGYNGKAFTVGVFGGVFTVSIN